MQQWLSKIEWQKLNKAFPIIFLIILLWLCWRLANLFWWFVAPPQLPTIQPVILGSQQTVMPNIVSFSLFEEQGSNPQSQTEVPLKLQGVVLANPRHLSSAVINAGNLSSSYRVGATIEGTSFTLTDVYWDRIMVREGSGSTREVKFGGEGVISNPPDQAQKIEAPAASFSGRRTQTPSNDSQGALNQAIEQLQTDREQYLSQMGVSAGQGGFEVTERTPPALRARLGLKPGDKVVSVNGQSISMGVNEAQLLEQIRKAGQAKIEIQRGDQTMTIQQNF